MDRVDLTDSPDSSPMSVSGESSFNLHCNFLENSIVNATDLSSSNVNHIKKLVVVFAWYRL